MAREIELKLGLTPQAARHLGQHPVLTGCVYQRQRLCNTYYDTPDLALTALRVALRFRYRGEQCLLTVKSAEVAAGGLAARHEWECPATPGVFDFSHIDIPALRAQLEAEQARLVPLFTTDFVRETWQVVWQDARIEVALDRGSIRATGVDGLIRQETLCELELELLQGQPADLFALARQFQAGMALHPVQASKAERGYRCFLGTPRKPCKATPSTLNAGMTPVAALRQSILETLTQLQANAEGLLYHESNPEFVHQARVALRRLRSLLQTFAPLLPDGFAPRHFRPFRPLMQQLGEVRNRDVFVQETLSPLLESDQAPEKLSRLQQRTIRAGARARRKVLACLQDAAYGQAVLDLTAALYALPDTITIAVDGATTLRRFAAARLADCAGQARTLAESLSYCQGEAEIVQRHRLRLLFKRLRYSLAAFAPLWPAAAEGDYLQRLVALQDLLGQLNDLATARCLAGDKQHWLAGWIAAREQYLRTLLPAVLHDWLAALPPWDENGAACP